MGSAHWTDGSEPSVDLDLEAAAEIIRKRGIRRIGLQLPEGLKRISEKVAEKIADMTGSEVIISGDPCYGACDIDLVLCEEVDLLIHIGHAGMLGGGPLLDKVIYIEAQIRSDLRPAVEKAIPLLKTKRVGVATTVQHVHRIGEALEVLKEHGILGVLGEPGQRTKYRGQVLGCDYSAARSLDVTEHIFVGTGQFHPLGMALATGKRVVAADPVACQVSVIDPEPMLRRRYAAIARAAGARKIAVLVTKKPGQKRMELARKMVEIGALDNREMYLVYLDCVVPDILINLGAEAAVSTACPRVALDDAPIFSIPLLTPSEFEILLGKRKDYQMDEIVD